MRLRVEGWLSKDQDCGFKSRCLQLKHFVERYSKLPSATRATPQSVGYALATWINGLYSTGVLSNPYKRAMLQSVHPLVADRVAKWEQKTHRINLPKWEVMLATLVNYVTANGCLPQSASKSSDYLYEWFSRQLRRLAQLPGELLEKLHQSHPLIAAAVAARSPKKVQLDRSAEWSSDCSGPKARLAKLSMQSSVSACISLGQSSKNSH